jgi:toxin ParE1/3/4
MGLVRLSHLADGDLDAIRDNIEAQHPSAADRVLDALFHTLELLAGQPHIGEQRDDLSPSLRVFSVRPYVILFYPAADGIHVARIVHGARDFPAHFPAT